MLDDDNKSGAPGPHSDRPDIFISYAREDRALASELARVLTAQRWSIWWDTEIDGGAPFADVIAEKLGVVKLVVVLWSAQSVKSTFVRDEAARALEARKLLPIRIEPVSPPLGFGQIHTLDLLEWNGAGDHAALVAVVEEVRELLGQERTDIAPPEPARRPLRSQFRLLAIGLIAALIIAVGIGVWYRNRGDDGDIRLASDLTLQGIEQLEAREYGKARYLFNQAARADRHFAPAFYYLAQVLIQSGASEEAGKNLQRALDLRTGLDGAQLADAQRWLQELKAAHAEPKPIATAAQVPRDEVPAVPVAPATPSSSGHAAEPVPATPVALSGPALAELAKEVEAMFDERKDVRIGATTSLIVDPDRQSDAVPLAIGKALQVQAAGAPSTPATRSGIINVLVLLQSATPATLNPHREEIKKLILNARSTGAQTAAQSDKVRQLLRDADGKRPVVYIQIADEAQRKWAAAFAAKLQQAGFDTPGIELVGDKAPAAHTEIRVHGNSDRGWARWLAGTTAADVGSEPQMVTLRNVKASNDIFEIWVDRQLCVGAGRQGPECQG